MTTGAISLNAAVTSLGKDTNRIFLIGGAQLYNQALAPRPQHPDSDSSWDTQAAPSTSQATSSVDRVLLTRITSPDFECDTFLTDFASPHRSESTSVEQEAWILCSHRELCEWLGWDAPEGDNEEKGVVYHYEMWARVAAQ